MTDWPLPQFQKGSNFPKQQKRKLPFQAWLSRSDRVWHSWVLIAFMTVWVMGELLLWGKHQVRIPSWAASMEREKSCGIRAKPSSGKISIRLWRFVRGESQVCLPLRCEYRLRMSERRACWVGSGGQWLHRVRTKALSHTLCVEFLSGHKLADRKKYRCRLKDKRLQKKNYIYIIVRAITVKKPHAFPWLYTLFP